MLCPLPRQRQSIIHPPTAYMLVRRSNFLPSSISLLILPLSLLAPVSSCSVFSSPMAKKAVLKLTTMSDDKTRRKAMEAVVDVPGVSSVAADIGQHKLTIAGEMDIIAVAKKLKKIGKVDVISFSTS